LPEIFPEWLVAEAGMAGSQTKGSASLTTKGGRLSIDRRTFLKASAVTGRTVVVLPRNDLVKPADAVSRPSERGLPNFVGAEEAYV
jgi:hypothetical protein